MDLPAASWVNLALQIPLALVILISTIYFLRHLEKRDASLEKMNERMLAFLEAQAKTNQDFIKQIQEQHNASIGRLAEEIKSNRVDTISEVSALTNKVDSMIEKISSMAERFSTLVEKISMVILSLNDKR